MTELAAGLAIGLGAGVSPGPLLALVVSASLERGWAAGARVAAAPLVTDAPIVAVAVAVVGSVPDQVMRGLGITGGIVVVALGVQTVLRGGDADAAVAPRARHDLWRGVVVNLLSPHPWIFWVAAGAPLTVSAWRVSPVRGVAFVAGFYALLVGSKLVIAWVVARGADRLSPARRRLLVAISGVALAAGGLVLFWQAAAGRL